MPNPSPWPLHWATPSSNPPSLLTQMTIVTSWWVSHVHLDPLQSTLHTAARGIFWKCKSDLVTSHQDPSKASLTIQMEERLLTMDFKALCSLAPPMSPHSSSLCSSHTGLFPDALPNANFLHATGPLPMLPRLEHSTSPSLPPSSCLSWLTPILQPTCHLLQDTLPDFPV